MKIFYTGILLLLGACSGFDMQGNDPKDYYKKHPIANTVEDREQSFVVHFAKGEDRLSHNEIETLRDALRIISPMAVDHARVSLAPKQASEARKEHLARLLRGLGYGGHAVTFAVSEKIARDEAQIDLSYAVVIPPRCPDWRTSPVTTYSNTSQANYGCASAVNLGAQVADPHDLVRGSGVALPDTSRNNVVINNYRTGVSPTVSTSPGGGTTGSASSNVSIGNSSAETGSTE